MKKISIIPIFVALSISLFTGCGNGIFIADDENITVVYTIQTLENRDIPSSATMSALSEDTKVKITRDIESDMMNVYVFSGSVEVTE